jgi:hypothetical protein
MLLEDVAIRLNTPPHQLMRESLRVYLKHRLRTVESDLFQLAKHYGVKTVSDLDEAVQAGRFSEQEAFEDFFQFDYLEDERAKLQDLLDQV